MKYDLRQQKCIGDERFCACTQQNQSQRRRTSPSRHQSSQSQSTSSGIEENDLSSASSTRLCGFLDSLVEHRESVKRYPGHNGRACVVCGKSTSKHCAKCNKAMHFTAPEDYDGNTSCFMHFHDAGFFGLARDDCKIVRKRQNDWSFPSKDEQKANSQQMKQMQKRLKENNNSDQIAVDHDTPNSSSST